MTFPFVRVCVQDPSNALTTTAACLVDSTVGSERWFKKSLIQVTKEQVSAYVKNSARECNDGYWVRDAPRANIMAYFFPRDKLFDALQVYRDYVGSWSTTRSVQVLLS